MPHLILEGAVDVDLASVSLTSEVERWGTAVLKTEAVWRRVNGDAILVEGVVVEYSRPLHPVAVVSTGENSTSVRLWRLAPVERTPAVQRWLVSIAAELCRLGAGPLQTTNIAPDLWRDVMNGAG